MRPLLLLILLSLTPLLRAAITDQPVRSGAAATYDELQVTCKTLLAQGAQGNINALTRFYNTVSNAPIREAITAASSLYWMLRQQIGESDKYAEHLQKNFPNNPYKTLVEKSANLVACTNCQDGVGTIPCTDCGGTSKCRTCGGDGKVSGITSGGTSLSAAPAPAGQGGGSSRAGGGITRLGAPATPAARAELTSTPKQTCSVCEGIGSCKRCKGTKVVRGTCLLCQGLKSSFVPARTLMAYNAVLAHLRDMAMATAMTERGQVRVEGRWMEATAAETLRKERASELASFAKIAAEAEQNTNYPAAIQHLENVIQQCPSSAYTRDLIRIKEMMQAEAADTRLPPKTLQGAAIWKAVQDSPARNLRGVLETVLAACRNGTNATSLLSADLPHRALPENPLRWQIGEPELIGRAARIPVTLDRPSRSGLPLPEAWEFRLIYNRSQWQIWQANGL